MDNITSALSNTTILTSTEQSTCPDQQYWLDIGELTTFIVYKVLLFVYIFVGLAGNILNVIVFVKQVKKDTGFTYQIVLVFSQITEIFFFALYSLSLKWFSDSSWYQANYYLMAYRCYFAMSLCEAAMMNTVFITLATALDRLLALAKPHAYAKANHKKILILVVLLSLFLAGCFGICEGLREYPKESNGIYVSAQNTAFMESTTATVMYTCRDTVRSLAAVVLIVANVSMVVLYRRNVKHVVKALDLDKEEYKKRQAAQKVLTLLAITVSTSTFLSVLAVVIFNHFVITRNDMWGCKLTFSSGTMDGTIFICHVLDLCFLLVFSKRYRKMVGDAVPILKRCCT